MYATDMATDIQNKSIPSPIQKYTRPTCVKIYSTQVPTDIQKRRDQQPNDSQPQSPLTSIPKCMGSFKNLRSNSDYQSIPRSMNKCMRPRYLAMPSPNAVLMVSTENVLTQT